MSKRNIIIAVGVVVATLVAICLVLWMRKESYDKPLPVTPNQKTRMLSNGELVDVLPAPIDLEISTRCPSKYYLYDMETYQGFIWNGQTNAYGNWKIIRHYSPEGMPSHETIIDVQRELKTHGFKLGTWGPSKDGVDGRLHVATQIALYQCPKIARKYKLTISTGIPELGGYSPPTCGAIDRKYNIINAPGPLRTLRSREIVESYIEPISLTLYTQCPDKYMLYDMETGEMYLWSGGMRGKWTLILHIRHPSSTGIYYEQVLAAQRDLKALGAKIGDVRSKDDGVDGVLRLQTIRALHKHKDIAGKHNLLSLLE